MLLYFLAENYIVYRLQQHICKKEQHCSFLFNLYILKEGKKFETNEIYFMKKKIDEQIAKNNNNNIYQIEEKTE